MSSSNQRTSGGREWDGRTDGRTERCSDGVRGAQSTRQMEMTGPEAHHERDGMSAELARSKGCHCEGTPIELSPLTRLVLADVGVHISSLSVHVYPRSVMPSPAPLQSRPVTSWPVGRVTWTLCHCEERRLAGQSVWTPTHHTDATWRRQPTT
jgi:hypothetical protein